MSCCRNHSWNSSTLRKIRDLANSDDMVCFENRFRCKDGSWRWLAWTIPAPADGDDVLYAIARDITAYKQVQGGPLVGDSVYAAMHTGLVITDPNQPDNPIIDCNPAFLKNTGYDKEEILGRNCRFLQNDDRNQKPLDEVRAALNEQRPCRVVLRNYRKDGTLFWSGWWILERRM